MTSNANRWTIVGVFAAWAALGANATVFTFNPEGTEGRWHVPRNWQPPGTPGLGDTAIIPTGKTCVVIGSEGSIGELIIQSGAMVRVV